MRGRPRTLTAMLSQKAGRDPDGTPLIVPGRGGGHDITVTYAEIRDRSLAIAAYLQESAGIQPYERVAVAAPAGLDFLSCLYGAMLAKAIPVPVPPPLTSGMVDRYASIVHDCSPARILTGDGWDSLFDSPAIAGGGVTDVSMITSAPHGWEPDREIMPDDTAYIQYTSGTSGTPKGAVITHEVALAGLEKTRRHMRRGLRGLSASPLPPWHDFACAMLQLAMYTGHTVLAADVRAWATDPVSLLEDASRHRATSMVLPSLAYPLICARLGRASRARLARLDLSSLRHIITGADVADPDSADAFLEALAPYGLRPDVIRETYGFAEAMLAVTCEPLAGSHITVTADTGHLADGRIVPSGSGTRLSAAGKPLPGTRLKIRRLDGTGFCDDGEIGEVVLQGTQLSTGYWMRPSQWIRIDGENWLRLEDIGALVDGNFIPLGRRRDMIVTGSDSRKPHRYPPALIERTARRAAAGAVRPQTVTALQDDDRVIIAAELTPGADPAAAAAEITGAVVLEHGIPVADVVLAEKGAIPLTTSGKLQRSECRDRYRAGNLQRLIEPPSESPAA